MGDISFTGSMPEYYDRCLGPAWFDAFATDLARRLPVAPPGDVLEIACGTGLLTRRLRERLAPEFRLVATDLSVAMLDYARRTLGEGRGIEWQEADAANLPFGDRRFGAVVCAFGFMFVPDKVGAFREALRVLAPGGLLLFNVWDSIEQNPAAAASAGVIESLYPDDPELRFSVPYEMHDPELLRSLLAEAGFAEPRIETRRHQLEAVSARTIATGQIRGTPRSLLIEKRGGVLDEVIDKAAAALTATGGADPYRGWAQALVVQAGRPLPH